MSSLPKNVGLLAGVVAVCSALLAGLLRHTPPLVAAKRAVLCGLVLTLVAWLCAHLALGVLHDGTRRHRQDNSV